MPMAKAGNLGVSMGVASPVSPDEEQAPRWKYDPGESPKIKHGWSQDKAGFVRRDKGLIGKCPKGMTNGEAERLLNDGIPDSSVRGDAEHPGRVYVVHDGVLYRAVPTLAGVSYHGFPEDPKEFDRLDDDLQRRIWERAHSLGQEKALKTWLRQTW